MTRSGPLSAVNAEMHHRADSACHTASRIGSQDARPSAVACLHAEIRGGREGQLMPGGRNHKRRLNLQVQYADRHRICGHGPLEHGGLRGIALLPTDAIGEHLR
jgi:hypothetical protein